VHALQKGDRQMPDARGVRQDYALQEIQKFSAVDRQWGVHPVFSIGKRGADRCQGPELLGADAVRRRLR
jgi:fructose-1,6-bisphosphatase